MTEYSRAIRAKVWDGRINSPVFDARIYAKDLKDRRVIRLLTSSSEENFLIFQQIVNS